MDLTQWLKTADIELIVQMMKCGKPYGSISTGHVTRSATGNPSVKSHWMWTDAKKQYDLQENLSIWGSVMKKNILITSAINVCWITSTKISWSREKWNCNSRISTTQNFCQNSHAKILLVVLENAKNELSKHYTYTVNHCVHRKVSPWRFFNNMSKTLPNWT